MLFYCAFSYEIQEYFKTIISNIQYMFRTSRVFINNIILSVVFLTFLMDINQLNFIMSIFVINTIISNLTMIVFFGLLLMECFVFYAKIFSIVLVRFQYTYMTLFIINLSYDIVNRFI